MIKSKHITDHLTAENFKDVQFMTAVEKVKIAKQWEKFVRARCAMTYEDLWELCVIPKEWTKALYQHFYLHLGHIAHFNAHGFFHEQWLRSDNFSRNMEQLASDRDNRGAPVARGAWGANADYEDLGHWIVEAAKEYLEVALTKCHGERKEVATRRLKEAQQELAELNES